MSLLISRTSLLGAALAAIVVAPPTATHAQELPEATAVIARYVDALGGRDAVLGRTLARTTGSFEVPAAGLKGDLEVVTRAPNALASKVTVPGMGEMRSGFDGTVGWSMDPMTGARLLDGAELEDMREQANPLATVRDASLVDAVETVERAQMGGVDCYRVKLVWKSGRESTDCYAVDSGLLVASTAERETPMGRIQVVSHYEDYRDLGGMKMPTRIVQELMGVQQVMVISNVETEGVDAGAVEPPPEILALIRAKQ
jgi:hypothetical protein